MQYSPLAFALKLPKPAYDPISGTMMALTAVGGALSAAGTLAAGDSAATMGRLQQQSEEFAATQSVMNSAADRATAQRSALDIANKARLMQSSAVAGAAAGGVNAGTGSALTNEAQIGARGRYASALELWNGENAASGDLNKAAAAHYSGLVDVVGGDLAQKASRYAAAGTLASAGGSAFKLYNSAGSGLNTLRSGSGWGPGVGESGPVPYG